MQFTPGTTAMRAAFAFMLLFCLSRSVAAIDQSVLEAERQRVEVMARVAPSVVAIFAGSGQGGGSGVLISADGYALSNFHVTNGAGFFMKCGLPDGRLYDAVLVGIDPTGDVALIKLVGREDFPFAHMGDSDTVAMGDWAFAMGNPFLLATDYQPTVTYGIVSGIHRYQYPAGSFLEYTDCIQVDASINPGNSGGPLFSATGDLIGINGRGSFEKRGRVNSGAGYAISINQIKNFLDHLRSGRIVDHATLGATVVARNDGTITISEILEASDAYRRGLRVDDELVSFAGRPIRSVNQFKNILGIYPKNWQLPVVYRRDGKKQEVLVRLRGLHRESELMGPGKKRPGPGGPPRPDRDPKQPNPDPKQPNPDRRPADHPHGTPPPPPEHLAKLLVQKQGYANYYFNSREQERVLKGISALGDFSGDGGTWKLAGSLVSGGQEARCDLMLSDKGVVLKLDGGKQEFLQPLTGGVDWEDEPPQTGGLLLALHHLRWMLTRGPRGFSDFYYEGSEPLGGVGERVDVLVAELSGARSRWYLQPNTAALVGFELQRSDDVDPCEIRFDSFRDFSGKKLPDRFSVESGDRPFGQFTIQGYTLAPTASAEKAAAPPEKAAEPAANADADNANTKDLQ